MNPGLVPMLSHKLSSKTTVVHEHVIVGKSEFLHFLYLFSHEKLEMIWHGSFTHRNPTNLQWLAWKL